MKNERDLFQAWYEDAYHEISQMLPSGQYASLRQQHSWGAWQASAQREGYKLVPLEMYWHKADDLASAEWERHKALFCSDNRDMTAFQVEEFRLRWCKNKAHQIMNDYKAMIGAADE